jgi:chromosome segregation ATPase
MGWSWGRFLVTLVIGAICALIYWAFFHKRGKRYEQTFDRVVEESTDESTKIRTLTGEHTAALKARDDAAAKVATDHQSTIQGLRAELESSKSQITTLVGQSSASDADRKTIADLRSQLSAANGRIATMAQERDSALANDSEDAKSIADLRAELNTANTRVASLLSERDGANTRIQGLVGERDTAKSSGDADKRQLADLRAQLDAANGRIGQLTKERDSATSNDAADAKTITDLRSQLDACSGRVQTLTGELAAARADHDAATSQVLSLRGQMDDLLAPPDDLLPIEGIGPKINAALNAAGITRWVHVRDASEERLTAAINAAGITFAPSLSTWGKQAEFLVKGDQAGFDAYVQHLTAGREPGKN